MYQSEDKEWIDGGKEWGGGWEGRCGEGVAGCNSSVS